MAFALLVKRGRWLGILNLCPLCTVCYTGRVWKNAISNIAHNFKKRILWWDFLPKTLDLIYRKVAILC